LEVLQVLVILGWSSYWFIRGARGFASWHHVGIKLGSRPKARGIAAMRVQIYTTDREQPIDLEVLEMRTRAREINTNENGQQRDPSVDKTIREVIKDPAIGTSANLLFTTPDGEEGAIYLNTEKVAAVVTSWSGMPKQPE
jgi:hypothetical protein